MPFQFIHNCEPSSLPNRKSFRLEQGRDTFQYFKQQLPTSNNPTVEERLAINWFQNPQDNYPLKVVQINQVAIMEWNLISIVQQVLGFDINCTIKRCPETLVYGYEMLVITYNVVEFFQIYSFLKDELLVDASFSVILSSIKVPNFYSYHALQYSLQQARIQNSLLKIPIIAPNNFKYWCQPKFVDDIKFTFVPGCILGRFLEFRQLQLYQWDCVVDAPALLLVNDQPVNVSQVRYDEVKSFRDFQVENTWRFQKKSTVLGHRYFAQLPAYYNRLAQANKKESQRMFRHSNFIFCPQEKFLYLSTGYHTQFGDNEIRWGQSKRNFSEI